MMNWFSQKSPSQTVRLILVGTIIFSFSISKEELIKKNIVKNVENNFKESDFRKPASVKTKEAPTPRKPIPATLKPLQVKDLRKNMNTTEIKSVLLEHFFPKSMGKDYEVEVLSYRGGLYKKSHFEVDAYKVQVEIKRKSDGAINNFSLWFDKKNQVVLESFGKNKIEHGKAVRLSHPLLQH